jgi:hypothetical protein
MRRSLPLVVVLALVVAWVEWRVRRIAEERREGYAGPDPRDVTATLRRATDLTKGER